MKVKIEENYHKSNNERWVQSLKVQYKTNNYTFLILN